MTWFTINSFFIKPLTLKSSSTNTNSIAHCRLHPAAICCVAARSGYMKLGTNERTSKGGAARVRACLVHTFQSVVT
jgi:hypothetical protein